VRSGTLGKLARSLDPSPADLLKEYLKAIKTLAQARKLQTNTPGVQFNTQINLGESLCEVFKGALSAFTRIWKGEILGYGSGQ
jgi:hypothetical protein